MGSFSTLGVILCSVFAVIIMCFVAELSYIFGWKKKLPNKHTEQQQQQKNSTMLLSFLFCCWKKNPISSINFYSKEELNSSSTGDETSIIIHNNQQEDLESGRRNSSREETILREELVEESVEAELIRLHNLCGPPRFLYTINEETTEDLMESEKGSRRRRSLSDLIDSPLTPHHGHGFNPLFESISERELLNKLRSSPPPKFKFLRDADEKLRKKLLVEEAEKMVMKNGIVALQQDSYVVEEKDASFITFLNVKKKQTEKEFHHLQLQQVSVQNSASSKVIPLATSPSSV